MGIVRKLRIGGQRTMLAIEGLNSERYCIGIIRAEPREDLTGSLISFDDSNLTDVKGGSYNLNPAHSPSRNVGQEANWRPSEAILVS